MNVNRRPLAAVICLLAACGPIGVSPTPDRATCVPNEPRACSTLGGVVLGRWHGSISAEVGLNPPACDRCADALGTARSALDRLAPEHLPPIGIDRFDTDPFLSTTGIYVFSFSDGGVLPIVVECQRTIGGICRQVDHPAQ